MEGFHLITSNLSEKGAAGIYQCSRTDWFWGLFTTYEKNLIFMREENNGSISDAEFNLLAEQFRDYLGVPAYLWEEFSSEF